MSDISSFRNKNPSIQSKFISQLEQEFTTIVRLLYSSSVPRPALESQILPYIAKNIHFKDPLQEGNGKELYRDSIKGFHNLFYFTHDTFQLQIKLNNDGRTGRCIVDGIINIRQFSWLYTYPLRAMFVFEFRLLSNPTTDKPQFEIFRHEEMWFVFCFVCVLNQKKKVESFKGQFVI